MAKGWAPEKSDSFTLQKLEPFISRKKEKFSYAFNVEKLTGDRWVDGLPIYRKVLDFGLMPNTTGKAIGAGTSGIDQMITLRGIASDSMFFTPIPYASAGLPADTVTIYYDRSTDLITITTASAGWIGRTAIIIMEYTRRI